MRYRRTIKSIFLQFFLKKDISERFIFKKPKNKVAPKKKDL
jgi:hypothetical protein